MFLSRFFENRATRRRLGRRKPQRRTFRPLVEILEGRQLLSISPTFSSLGTTFNTDQKDLYIPLTSGDTGKTVTYSLGTHSNSAFTAEILKNNPTIKINVSGGGFTNEDITLELFKNLAPKTVAHFQQLVTAGTYTAESFYRVITAASGQGNFLLAQGGTKAGTGANIDDEFNAKLAYNSPGIIAMARQTPHDTGSSEFFITDPNVSYALTKDTTLEGALNFKYTPFGQITSGFAAFQKIMTTAVKFNGSGEKSEPVTPITINSISVVTNKENAVLHVSRTSTGTATDTFMVTASDGTSASKSQTLTIKGFQSTLNDPPFLGPVPEKLVSTEAAPVHFKLTSVNTDGGAINYVVGNLVGSDINHRMFANAAHVTASINQTTGDVTLTPEAGFSGTINLTAGVTNQEAGTTAETAYDTQAFQLVVNSGTLTPTTLPDGVKKAAYHQEIVFHDVVGATSVVANNVKNAIPGITLTGGIDRLTVGGTPTAVGTETFTIVATNKTAGTTTADYTLTVNAAGAIVVTPTTLPAGTPNKTYNQTITATGGAGTLSFAVTNIQHAIAGLNVPTGGTGSLHITGTPTAEGTMTFTLTVTDAANVEKVVNYSIKVSEKPDAPTAIKFDAGDSTLGNMVTTNEASLTVNAATGMTVVFTVNGKSAKATEGTAGVYTVSLPAGSLAVGTNAITAKATDAQGRTSDASTALSLVFAPSFQYMYTVPGTPGAASTQTVDFIREAVFDNEIGYFVVDDVDGTVGGLKPGDEGYAQAALSSATKKILIPSGSTTGFSGSITAEGGQLLGFYLVQNDSSANLLANNPMNRLAGGPLAFFSFDAANPDRVRHVRTTGDAQTGYVQYSFEDKTGGGDADYNDGVVTVRPGTVTAPSLGVVRTPGTTGGAAVTETFTLSSAKPELKTVTGEFGIYFVDDVNGTVGGIAPGASGYAAAALATARPLFTNASTVGATATSSLPAGQLFAFYTTIGGTATQFLAAGTTVKPTVLFSLDKANGDTKNHFRWFAPDGIDQGLPTIGETDPLRLHVLRDPSGLDDFTVDLTQGT